MVKVLFFVLALLVGRVSLAQSCSYAAAKDDAYKWANLQCSGAGSYCLCHQYPGCVCQVVPKIYADPRGYLTISLFCKNTYSDGTVQEFGLSYYSTCGDISPPVNTQKCESACCASGAGGSSEVRKGSIINVDYQSLGEVVPLVGVPFDLTYSTDLVKDRTQNYRAALRVSESSLSPTATGFNIKIYNELNNVVANQNYAVAPDIFHTFTWNGNLASGAASESAINYRYVITETNTAYGSASLGFPLILGTFQAKSIGLGGWLPSIYRYYDFRAKRIVYANGQTREVSTTSNSATTYGVADSNGDEYLEFLSNGRLKKIRTGVTGQTKYEFFYDTLNRLSSVQDGFGKITRFNRNTSGVLTSITTPYNKTITIGIDTSGRLIKVTEPSTQFYSMTYKTTTGLLQTFVKPNGAKNTFSYDILGNLIQDAHSGGFIQKLVRTVDKSDEIQVQYTHSGKSSVQTTINKPIYMSRTVEDPTAPTKTVNFSKLEEMTADSGAIYYRSYRTGHPRFGDQAKDPMQVAGGELGQHEMSISYRQDVTLNNPSDPFSISSWTITATDGNSQNFIKSYNPTTRKWILTTPMGKTSNYITDVHERTTQSQVGNLTVTNFTYVGENLTQIQQGTRTTVLAYSPTTGLLASVRNPLSQVTSYSYDTNERLASILRPDGQSILFSYNSVGQLASVTPVSRPAHVFAFNASELVSQYTPPTTPLATVPQTKYTYIANQIKTITRPDGKVVTYNYDSTSSLLTSIASAEATINVERDPSTNLPRRLSSTNRMGVQTFYTGRVTSTEYTEEVNSSVASHIYMRWFNITNGQISYDDLFPAGGGSGYINYSYNNDQELSQAGDVSYTYTVPSGLLNKTISGATNNQVATNTYNTFGEMLTQTTLVGTTQVHKLTLTYDGMGRIKTKKDTIPSVTTPAYDYTYNNLGRLTVVKNGTTTLRTYTYDLNGNRTKLLAGTTTTNYIELHN